MSIPRWPLRSSTEELNFTILHTLTSRFAESYLIITARASSLNPCFSLTLAWHPDREACGDTMIERPAGSQESPAFLSPTPRRLNLRTERFLCEPRMDRWVSFHVVRAHIHRPSMHTMSHTTERGHHHCKNYSPKSPSSSSPGMLT